MCAVFRSLDCTVGSLQIVVHKRPAGIWMRITCWTDFVSEFVPLFYLRNSFSDCDGKTTHKLHYGRAESPSSGPLLFRGV